VTAIVGFANLALPGAVAALQLEGVLFTSPQLSLSSSLEIIRSFSRIATLPREPAPKTMRC